MTSTFRPGDIYEDCSFHPVLCTEVGRPEDPDANVGISLTDGSTPRSCSQGSCGVEPLSIEQVVAIKEDVEAYLALRDEQWRSRGPCPPPSERSIRLSRTLRSGATPDDASSRWLAVAEVAHAGQTDEDGHDCVEHVRRGVALVGQLAPAAIRTACATVAALHDVLEDTPTTPDDLADLRSR